MTCMCRPTILTEWIYSWHIPYGSVVCPGPGDREKVPADSAHILSRYTTWKALSRWVPEHRTQQDSGTASYTLWTWIAVGKWCSCRHFIPPPGCRVVLYTLTLFIDVYKDYAFSLACQEICQLTLTVSCWGLCVAEMDEVTWLWTITQQYYLKLIAGRFGHVDLRQLRSYMQLTKAFVAETSSKQWLIDSTT